MLPANPETLYQNLNQLGNTNPQWLARIKALKAQGLTGWDCIYQAVDDAKRENSATESQQQQAYNRVELAFSALGDEERRLLFYVAQLFARRRGERFIRKWQTPLREFTGNERACIATAIQKMSQVREQFGKNLKRLEFHPEGAAL